MAGEISPKLRANTQLTGNTAGQSIVAGLPVLSGGNNITLSGSGNTVVISAAAAAGFSAGVSNIGNTAGTTGTVSNAVLFAGQGAVTLSQSTGAGGATVSISAPAQTIQSGNLVAIGNTAGSTSSTTYNTNLSFSGAGGVSVGYSGDTVIVSGATTAAQTIQTANLIAIGNTTGSTSSTTFNTNLSFSGSGGVSVGYSGDTVIIAGATTAAQTIQTANLVAIGNTTGSTSNTTFNTNLSFSGAGNVSVGYSGDTIIVSGAAGGGAAFSAGASTIGNTAGTTGTVNNQLILAASSGVSLSASTAAGGATVTIIGPGSGALSTQNSTAVGNLIGGAGTTSSTSFGNAESISGAGGASVGFSGQTVVISAPATSAQSWYAIGNTTASTSSTTFQNNFSVSGGSNISVGFSGNTLVISDTAAGGGGGYTMSKTYFPVGANIASGTSGLGAGPTQLFIQYCPVPQNVSISRAAVFVSISPQTSAAASTGSWSCTLAMGIYTRNGTSYSTLMATTNSTYSASWSSTNSGSLFTAWQLLSVPLSTLLTPNEYWIMAIVGAATGGNLSASQSLLLVTAPIRTQVVNTFSNTGTGAFYAGDGTSATAATTLPASLGMVTTGGQRGDYMLQLDNYAVT